MLVEDGGGYTYSNSIEALRYCIAADFKCIEIDVRVTKDGKIVCVHDFLCENPPMYSEFMKEQLDLRWTPMDLIQCLRICSNNNILLIVDTKNNRELEMIVHCLEENEQIKNIWIQIFKEEDMKLLKNKEVNVLYNLTFETNYIRVARFCKAFGIKQVSISLDCINKNNEWYYLVENDIRVYVHTVNNMKTYYDLKSKGIAGVFTDYILPEQLEK